MTPEDMIRVFGQEYKPPRDAGGRVIRPPSFTPYKTTEQKAENPKVIQDKNDGRRGNKLLKFKHVTKEFIQMELAAGKSLHAIGAENGMSPTLIFSRAEKMGLHKPVKRVRGFSGNK
jgi:hypothetical protein